MRWFVQASSSDCSNPRLCRLLLCILDSPSGFPNPHHSHHTGSSAHLGVPCIRTSIFNCHKRSFSHLGVDRLRPSIPIIHPDSSPFPLRSYYMPISPPLLLLLLDSRKSSRVSQSCFYFASWHHHTFLLRTPPPCPVSLENTSNKGHSANHCATVSCRHSL